MTHPHFGMHDDHDVPHSKMHLSRYHTTHGVLDHKFDDQHDIEPVHFHEHAIHKAFPHPDSHDYEHTLEIEREHIPGMHEAALHHASGYEYTTHWPTFEESYPHHKMTEGTYIPLRIE